MWRAIWNNFFRPGGRRGSDGLFGRWPSDESLGYFRSSSWDFILATLDTRRSTNHLHLNARQCPKASGLLPHAAPRLCGLSSARQGER